MGSVAFVCVPLSPCQAVVPLGILEAQAGERENFGILTPMFFFGCCSALLTLRSGPTAVALKLKAFDGDTDIPRHGGISQVVDL